MARPLTARARPEPVLTLSAGPLRLHTACQSGPRIGLGMGNSARFRAHGTWLPKNPSLKGTRRGTAESAVSSGLMAFLTLNPTLKGWAIVKNPSGMPKWGLFSPHPRDAATAPVSHILADAHTGTVVTRSSACRNSARSHVSPDAATVTAFTTSALGCPNGGRRTPQLKSADFGCSQCFC